MSGLRPVMEWGSLRVPRYPRTHASRMGTKSERSERAVPPQSYQCRSIESTELSYPVYLVRQVYVKNYDAGHADEKHCFESEDTERASRFPAPTHTAQALATAWPAGLRPARSGPPGLPRASAGVPDGPSLDGPGLDILPPFVRSGVFRVSWRWDSRNQWTLPVPGLTKGVKPGSRPRLGARANHMLACGRACAPSRATRQRRGPRQRAGPGRNGSTPGIAKHAQCPQRLCVLGVRVVCLHLP